MSVKTDRQSVEAHVHYMHKNIDIELVLALLKRAEDAEKVSPCGHPASLMLTSAETGKPLYCELCDDKSGRRDAERMEAELRTKLADAEAAREADKVDAERWQWALRTRGQRMAIEVNGNVARCYGIICEWPNLVEFADAALSAERVEVTT